MFEKGRLCTKLVGRDANKKCVIIKVIDENFVFIDGQTRRRRCNIKHIEPSNKVLQIKLNADHQEVKRALKKENIIVVSKKSKQKTSRQLKKRAKKLQTKVKKEVVISSS